jgi:hypothetical protein
VQLDAFTLGFVEIMGVIFLAGEQLANGQLVRGDVFELLPGEGFLAGSKRELGVRAGVEAVPLATRRCGEANVPALHVSLVLPVLVAQLGNVA